MSVLICVHWLSSNNVTICHFLTNQDERTWVLFCVDLSLSIYIKSFGNTSSYAGIYFVLVVFALDCSVLPSVTADLPV